MVIIISIIVVVSALIGSLFVLYGVIPNQLVSVFKIQNTEEKVSATTHVYGQLIDKDGDPVLEEVRIYLVDAHATPQGEVTSLEGERIHVAALYGDELRKTYSTDKKGYFDFTIPNGVYYFSFQSYWEPIDPVMVGRIWLSNESDKPAFGRVAFTGVPQKFTIKIHNNGYESKKESITLYTVKPNDSLWSLAEKYYSSGDQWALIARLNDIKLLPNKSILIEPGQIIKVPRKGWYESNEVAENLRTLVHSGEFNKTITYTNEEYHYQIKYPGFWILQDMTKQGALYSKRLLGPTIHLRMHSFSQQPAEVKIAIYDNTTNMTLEEFLIDKRYADKYPIENGDLSTKSFTHGGILIDGGTACYDYCNDHLVFFKNNKIYILSFPVLQWLKQDEESVYNELQSILNGFTIQEAQ